MAQYVVEISDQNGATILVRVAMPPIGNAHWEVLNNKFLRRQKGVVEQGDRGSNQTYVGLYGGPVVDDKLLVMHLDDFLEDGGVNAEGTGFLYNHDNRLMVPGPLSWKIAY
ncbi:MAG: hypothetical protein ACRENP_13685 [Longimicrobiales bacterium]